MEGRWGLVVGGIITFLVAQYFLLGGKLTTLSLSKDYRIPNATRNFAILPKPSTGVTPEDSSFVSDTILPGNSRLTKEQLETLKIRLKQASNQTKYILRWDAKTTERKKPWQSDLCGKCEFTNDRKMINHPDTGAVIIRYHKFSLNDLPKAPRRSDQLHVWFTGEAPYSLYNMRNLPLTLEEKYKFNLTQTYRRDFGIYQPYGSMEDILVEKWIRGEQEDISRILRNKTKLAVAVVSNCKATAGAKVRLQLLAKMKELGLKIDTFGRCFEQNIAEKHHEFEHVLAKYKFYLAFENSYHCRDYATEKFYINGFRSGAVPVALGATKEDYQAVAPADSFIYAEDFPSVEKLVNHLNYLDKNDREYLKYFKWIERGLLSLPMLGRVGRFCQLCRQLHGINVDDVYYPSYNASNPEIPLFTDGIAKRYVPELRKWYYQTENKDCFEKMPHRIKRFLNFSDFLPTA